MIIRRDLPIAYILDISSVVVWEYIHERIHLRFRHSVYFVHDYPFDIL